MVVLQCKGLKKLRQHKEQNPHRLPPMGVLFFFADACGAGSLGRMIGL
jgi:hypothetical protein